ncbi:hypothetical protein [Pollutibacter soli]
MPETDEKPPLFKTWKGWYALVIGLLLLQIILFAQLTKLFS